jgi:hypothetical protein
LDNVKVGTLVEFLRLGAGSISANDARESRAVELDGASPESRRGSWCGLDRIVLLARLGSGEVRGRRRG